MAFSHLSPHSHCYTYNFPPDSAFPAFFYVNYKKRDAGKIIFMIVPLFTLKNSCQFIPRRGEERKNSPCLHHVQDCRVLVGGCSWSHRLALHPTGRLV